MNDKQELNFRMVVDGVEFSYATEIEQYEAAQSMDFECSLTCYDRNGNPAYGYTKE